MQPQGVFLKRHWEVDELIEHWTLLPDEIALLGNKIGANRLGCAVLLKFFQSRGDSQRSYLPSGQRTNPQRFGERI